tara:strand:+ start:536 stop:1063 length:528 start_codon:yes stop_codon:yes gene_type:complete
MASEFGFDNVTELNFPLAKGLEFKAKPSFLKFPQSAGFNIRDSGYEYRGFLNPVDQEAFDLDNEFNLIVRGIKPRENDRTIIDLGQVLLKVGDKIYCRIGSPSPRYRNHRSSFKNYNVSIQSESSDGEPIADWEYAMVKVTHIGRLHEYCNVLPLVQMDMKEYESMKGKIFPSRT